MSGPPSPGVSPDRWRSARGLASLLLTGGLCFLLLRRIGPHELADWLARVDRSDYATFVALSLAGLFVRALRYHMLIGAHVGFVPLVLVTAARNFLVDLLPARIGSLSYVYLLNRRFGVPIEPVLSSFVLTFLYDLLAMSVLCAIAVLLQLGRFEGAVALGLVGAIFGAAVLVVFLELGTGLRIVSRWMCRSVMLARFAPRVEDVAAEVERSGGGGRRTLLLAVSVVIRLLKFGAYWALLLGVLREQDLGAAELPFWSVFLGIAGAELSATLPIHGIAGFGTYEAAWALGFGRLGISPRVAVLSGFATHLLSQLYDYTVGVAALVLALVVSRNRR